MQTQSQSRMSERPQELEARLSAALREPAAIKALGTKFLEECEVSLERTSSAVDSAILILFLKHNDETYLVFTRRPRGMRTSPGEIVLPGGRVDDGESAQEAALRECREETGIQVSEESLLGELPGFLRALRKDYWITPVVAMVTVDSLEFVANPDEVEEVILTPVNWWLEQDSQSAFFPVTGKREHPAKGNAFALAMLKQGLDTADASKGETVAHVCGTQTPLRTSRGWWEELKLSPERKVDWLKKQYHGELLAAERVAQFRDDCTGTRWFATLNTIARQEAKHAEWVGDLLRARGFEPQRLTKEERYWNVALKDVNSFEGMAAAAAHAEAMRLERIKVIYNDPTTETDIREVFRKILAEEQFHVKAFTRMAGDEALQAALAKHEAGMAAINVAMESGLIPFAE